MPLLPADVAVVLLNYNNESDTIDCLQALYGLAELPGWVIVVDNASSIESRNFLQASCKEAESSGKGALRLEWIWLSDNGGYSIGNNAGIRLALQKPSCRAVWILNNDTEPDPNALQALCDRLNACPDAAMVGSSLVYADERTIMQCAGGFEFSKYTGITPAVHGGESLEKVRKLPPASVEKKLSYLSGASFLVRRELFAHIGFLAEEYFLYYEDAEFGLRALKAGYALAWAPDSIVFHKEGGSTGAKSSSTYKMMKRSRFVDYLALRNRVYLVRKYYPASLLIVILSYAGVLLNRLRRKQANRIPLVFRALWDGLRGKMGKPVSCIADEEKELRILFLTLRADFGGGPEHLWQLVQRVPASARAYLACPKDYPYYERYCEVVEKSRIAILPHRVFSLRKLWRLRSFCRENGISVLHSHGKGAGLYARLLTVLTGLPCVHTFHGVHIGTYNPLKLYIYRLCERLMSSFTRAGLAVSESEKLQIVAERLMPLSKIRLIPNGVKAPASRTDAEQLLLPPYVVVTLSRFDYPKNSMFLLDIAKALDAKGRLGEFQFIAVGDGLDRQAVMDTAQTNGWADTIFCPGASTDPHSFFSSALCYLSTSRWEGMPLAVLEAMSHGLPVVASDVVGNRDAVRHGETGLLYTEGDAEAAVAALCRFADAPYLRRAMGANAREYILRNHSVEEMAAKTFAVLKEVVR